MTRSDNNRVSKSSEALSGAVRSTLPPRYTKPICIAHTALIISKKALFFDIPENKRRRSVRALKQLNIDANINKAKNAVSRYMLSGEYLKREVIDGNRRNARQSATVNEPRMTI